MDTNRVEIFGRFYTIKGIEDQEYLERLARLVDGHMRQIAAATGTVDTLKVAILAALTIADAYFKAKEEVQSVDKELERNIDALTDQVQFALTR